MRLTRNVPGFTTLVASALVLLPAAAAAQQDQPTDGRWQAWIGCWAPDAGRPGPDAVCVLPAGSNAVELLTVDDGRVTGRERIDASGVAVPSTREQCAGEDVAQWSADGRRVFMKSQHTCDGVQVRATGVMALPSANEWLDVRGVSVAGGPADVRVRRYHLLGDAAVLPREVSAELDAATAQRATLRSASRANAARPLSTEDVIQASRRIDATVLEAWLVENGDGFDVDARQLVRLADARVPSRVIDVMVALSYPQRFAFGRGAGGAEPMPRTDTTIVRPSDLPLYGTGLYGTGRRSRWCDDLVLDPMQQCFGRTPYGYAPYGYAPYGYAPYGWGGSAWGYGYGYGPGQPPVIVDRAKAGGRVVNGRGYTRGTSTGDGTEPARPRERGASPSGDRGSTRSAGGSSSSSGRSSGGSSSTKRTGGSERSSGGGRTAKPRNP